MTPSEGAPHEASSSATGGADDMNESLVIADLRSTVARGTVLNKRAIVYMRVSTKAQADRDGNAEGYSLPTQRTACRLRAEQLGAVVVDEYIDKDTGTRVDKRPAMLALIERVKQERDVDFVIVHQLSRFARNRLDDARITEDLEASGSRLVSCLEGIDQSTSGRMLQGILAVVNEYQSRNQGEDIKRKTLQKVKDGGTPSLAPIGYLNKQGLDGDNNKRWVEVDPVRGPHIIWAFQQYASGVHTLRSLADALEERGLGQRPTAKQPGRPVPANKLHAILRNPYYLGVVTYNGIQYEGKHPPLIDIVTFEKVRQLLEAHRQSGERAYRRTHYLKGTLRCHRCKSRLGYCISRGSKGGSYAYFFCLGRHERRTNCDLPHLQADEVETAVTDFYATDQLDPDELDGIRLDLLEDLLAADKRAESERKRLIAHITDIRHARNVLADKALEGTIPADIAQERQQALAPQLARAETDLARLDHISNATRLDIDMIFDLAKNAAGSYLNSTDHVRREWNFARYEALEIDVDYTEPYVAEARRTAIFEGLRTALRDEKASTTSKTLDKARARRQHNPVFCLVGGSRVELLVEVMGLEPTTSTMRT
jgi:site-specific DNA recombinase